MSAADLHIGSVVLVGNRNWQDAGWWLRLRVVLFARRQRFEHLGAGFVVGWRGERPYLIRIREAG